MSKEKEVKTIEDKKEYQDNLRQLRNMIDC